MISGQGKADEGDKHGIQLSSCSKQAYGVHLFQEHTKFLKICKMSVSFLCVKQIKQISMSLVVKYTVALFGCLWKNSTH